MGEKEVLYIDDICRIYGVSRTWVYQNAPKLCPIGINGKPLTPRRFDPVVVSRIISPIQSQQPVEPSSLKTKEKAKVSHKLASKGDLWL